MGATPNSLSLRRLNNSGGMGRAEELFKTLGELLEELIDKHL
jgi:hypothetical protein